MTERTPASRSTRAGRRGRHKHQSSAETQRWNREHLIPEKPEWMTPDTYRALAKLREQLT
jgi:hypothetical protein